MHTASYWDPAGDGQVRCGLCPHGCLIAERHAGLCGARRVIGGALWATGYGRLSALHSDPIEKKPLYHFHPGRAILSLGGWGCNFACRFCQNWQISQRIDRPAAETSPETLVDAARDQQSLGLAYTYNEPLINLEFVRDCAIAARAAGLANVLVTNGFVAEAPAAELLPLVDALNIDIKSMDDRFYRHLCRGSIAPVLRFARQAAAAGCHVEITTLLIPGLNDSAAQAGAVSAWVAAALGRRTPLHLSAYHPDYQMDLPATPPAVLARAGARCRQDLDYVYLGNVRTDDGQQTRCPGCGDVLIRRTGYRVDLAGLAGRACRGCGRPFDGVLPAA